MSNSIESPITRRRLLRFGVLAGVGAAVARSLHAVESPAAAVPLETTVTPTPPMCMPCNPNRPEDPNGALQALIAGNARWASGDQQHPGEDTATRTCNANPDCKQMPFAALLSCVDSRVPPELLFDQGIGDLFVARVAGNSVVPILEDSLAYGTASLHALVLFVLGHSLCGAVMAAVDSFLRNPEHPKPSFAFEPPIYPAVAAAQEIVAKQGGNPNDPAQVVPVTIDQHVILTVQYLASTNPFDYLVKNNDLLIKGGRYDLDTQNVVILV
jgi:carbonic anhydrase